MENVIDMLIYNYSELSVVQNDIKKAILIMEEVIKNDGKLLLCGNGGSATDCEHIVGELLKEFKIKRGLKKESIEKFEKYNIPESEYRNYSEGIAAISLVNSVGYSTAFTNDVNVEFKFAQEVFVLGNERDVLLAISTSGNSSNIIKAAKVARIKGMRIVGLTGKSGGKLKNYCDVCIKAPSDDTSRIQEFHLPIYHAICEILERDLFGN